MIVWFLSDLFRNPEDRFSDEMAQIRCVLSDCTSSLTSVSAFEPRREKTGFLHMQKQRRRSASR